MTQRGPALVRIALFCLFFGAFAIGLVQPAQAGTAEAPEIADPSGDPTATGDAPACPPEAGCAGPPQFIDLTLGWVAGETDTTVDFWMDVAGNANANAYGDAQFDFHFKVGESEYVAGFHVSIAGLPVVGTTGTGTVTPTGVATSAAYAEDAMMVTVPRSAIGDPAAGTSLTGLFVTSSLTVLEDTPVTFSDRAPNEGNGTDYLFTLGPGGGNVTDPNDSDSDGLNDTWETDNFGNATNANATGDPDGDGLTNGQEEALGTDPNQADTDADGCNDKEDSAPLDPAAGCGQGENTTSSTTTSSTTSSSSTSSTSTSSSSTSSGAQGSNKVDSFDEAVDRLTSDAGYLGMSAGGFLAVLVLAILALAVRWSL